MTVRVRVRITGTVQGVGFRPFVYRRAVLLGLSGWVGNDGQGVLLEAEGEAGAVTALLADLRSDAPPLATIEGIDVTDAVPDGEPGFRIAASAPGAATDVRVSADIAPCEACLSEMRDPRSRRYRYPFTNCTDCGPRYTIVREVPYDRATTSMASFPMCRTCRSEYDDPSDRRFHAQPIACPRCGPTLTWRAADAAERDDAALAAAAECLERGGIVAVKGVGGYHVACDAGSDASVEALRRRKRRDDKPFAVMVADLAAAHQLCELDEAAERALASPRRPIVLAPRRPGARVAQAVAPGLAELGVMLPSSPLHVLLLGCLPRPLVMTSGNRTDEPMAHRDAEALQSLAGLVDGMLTHDREIVVRVDDSVLRSSPGGLRMVRRARGWAPQPVRLPVAARSPVLAVGAQLKSTVTVAAGRSAVVSEHLGDLDDWTTYQAFVECIGRLVRLTGLRPAVIAHDLHRDYRSTAWASSSDLPLIGVQHHHAHVAACLVEHGITTPVLGIAFDGLGMGTDGTLWGGEFLLADLVTSTRVGHLLPAALPGGDAAVREPWRMALSWLHRSVGPEAAAAAGPGLDHRWPAVLSLVASGSCPETSSVGRLFDAVAALLGVRARTTYEGQAAVELEALARSAGGRGGDTYAFGRAGSCLDPGPMLADLLQARSRGTPAATLAAGFHRGLARAAALVAADLAVDNDVDVVALTGGVFQNALLTELLAAQLRDLGLRVLVHQELPCNDGAISVGQAAVAAASLPPP